MASLPRPRAAVGGGGWPLPAPSRGRRVAAVLSSQPRLLPDEFILSLVRSLCSGEEVRDLARRAALGPEAGVLRGRRLAARAAAAPAEGQPPTAPQPAARAAAAAAAGGGRRWAAATSMLQPWSGPGVLGAAPRVTPWVSTVGLARGPVTPLLQLSWGLILKMGGRASGVLGEDSAAKRRAEVGRGEGCSDPGRSAHPGHARLLVKGFRGVSQPDTVGEPWSSRYKGPHWLQLTDPTWVAWAGDTLAPTAGPHSCPLPSPHLPGPLGSGQRVGQTPGPPLTAPGTRRPLPLSTPVLTHWPPPPPTEKKCYRESYVSDEPELDRDPDLASRTSLGSPGGSGGDSGGGRPCPQRLWRLSAGSHCSSLSSGIAVDSQPGETSVDEPPCSSSSSQSSRSSIGGGRGGPEGDTWDQGPGERAAWPASPGHRSGV